MQLRPKTKQIIVHCSDSPDSREDIGVKEIREWHMKERGWQDIGYHFVVKRDGTVEVGRRENLVGAHTEGYNGKSLGICWVGRNTPTPMQYAKLLKKIKELMRRYQLAEGAVLGHYELNNKKTCPNLDMNKLREDLRAQIITLTELEGRFTLAKDKFNGEHLLNDKHLLDLNTNTFGKEESDV